jgi:WD40 repeat protein
MTRTKLIGFGILVTIAVLGSPATSLTGLYADQPAAQVDFATQILPLLQKNCLACHNKTDAESDLVLETPETMQKGGTDGSVVSPGNGAESRLYQLASHADEPHMPPEDNTVGAKKLTDEELSLLKNWIDQGAKGSTIVASSINWQPLPAGVNPVLALATSADGRLIAAGRANQVFLYHADSGADLGRLSDPALASSPLYGRPGVADLDLIQSLAVSPNGTWIASGAYRTLKLWRRDPIQKSHWPELADEPTSLTLGEGARFAVVGLLNGSLQRLDLESGNLSEPWSAHLRRVAHLATLSDSRFVSASDEGDLIVWDEGAEGKLAELKLPVPMRDCTAISETAMVIAHNDGTLRVWSLQQAPAGSAWPFVVEETAKLVEGSSIGCMESARGVMRLATGASDGVISIFDSQQNTLIRQWNQGSPVKRISISADGNRLASVGEDGKLRLWDSANGNLVAEPVAHAPLKDEVDRKQFARDLAKRQVENSKQDLEADKQRLQQETDNQKKSQENLAKGDEERKKKTEAAEAALAQVKEAEQSLATAKDQVAAADKALSEVVTSLQEAAAVCDERFVRLAEQQQAYAKGSDELRQATQALEQARQLAEQDKDNSQLAQQATDSQEKVRIATENRIALESARREALKEVDNALSLLDQARQAEQESQALLAKAKQAIEPAEKALAEKQSAAMKASNEQKEATRNFESATAAVEQANRAVEQAQAHVNQSQNDVAKTESKAQDAEAQYAAAEKQLNESPTRIRDIVFSNDSMWMSIVADDGSISICSAGKGQLVNWLSMGSRPYVGAASAGPDDLVVVSSDRSIQSLRILPSWSLDRTIGSPDGESAFSDRVTAVCFSPDSSELAVGGGTPSRSGEIKIYNVQDWTLKHDLPDVHSDVVYGLAYSPDGQYLASCSADRFMKVTDCRTAEVYRSFEGHTHHVLGVDWQADGRVLATAGADKVVKLWNFLDGSQIRTIQGFGKEATSVHYYGPNDLFFVVSGDRSIYQCNLGGNKNAVGNADDFLYCVSASHIGDTVAFGGHDSIVRVIDSSGKLRATMKPTN